MADHANILERDNGDGDVVFRTPELDYSQITVENAVNHVVIAIAMMQLMQINNNDDVLRRNVVNDGNGDHSQLDPGHVNPTSDSLPGNVVDDENEQNSQLTPDHANQKYGLYKLLNIYAVSQAGILAVVSSARRPVGWSPFMLSGLVSTAIIFVLLFKFSRQFTQLREEECRTWVARKAAVVVMLMASSLCVFALLHSLTLPSPK